MRPVAITERYAIGNRICEENAQTMLWQVNTPFSTSSTLYPYNLAFFQQCQPINLISVPYGKKINDLTTKS